MSIRIVSIVNIIFILFICAKCQKEEDVNKTNMEPIKKIISIKSPIVARLEIKKETGKLIAVMTIANVSDEDVIVDKNKLGGDRLKEHIFHLNPWYAHPNLIFKPYKPLISTGKSPDYMVMKPQEVIITNTNLIEYYNFNERKYNTLSISYVAKISYLDKYYKQITQKDEDGIMKPVIFYIMSNDVDLDYNKDIKNILEGGI